MDRPGRTCQRCGNPVQPGDGFCGVCGARVAPVTPEDPQVIPQQSAAAQAPPRSSRSMLLVTGIAVLLVFLLVGGGAFAFLSSRGEEGSGSTGHQQRGANGGPDTDKPKGNGTTVYTPDSSAEGETTVDLSDDTSPPAEPTTFTESTSSNTPPGSDEELRRAVEDYYEAVDQEDWSYTYDHLDSTTRSQFTREEWYEKNQYYADRDNLELSSMDVQINGSTTEPVISVTVYRTFNDGTSLGRDTFFVWEDGGWKHRFGEEENKLYMPDASYEQFVEAQQ